MLAANRAKITGVAFPTYSNLVCWRCSKRLLLVAARHSKTHHGASLASSSHARRRRGISGTDAAAQTHPARRAALGRRPDGHRRGRRDEPAHGRRRLRALLQSHGRGRRCCVIDGRVRGPGPAAVRVSAGVTGQRQRVLGRLRCFTGGPGPPLRRGLRWRREPGHRRRRRPHRHAGFIRVQARLRCGADAGLRRLGSILQPRGRPLVAFC